MSSWSEDVVHHVEFIGASETTRDTPLLLLTVNSAFVTGPNISVEEETIQGRQSPWLESHCAIELSHILTMCALLRSQCRL